MHLRLILSLSTHRACEFEVNTEWVPVPSASRYQVPDPIPVGVQWVTGVGHLVPVGYVVPEEGVTVRVPHVERYE